LGHFRLKYPLDSRLRGNDKRKLCVLCALCGYTKKFTLWRNMRVFIAIDIEKKVLEAITKLQQQLQRKAKVNEKFVKWVEPENMHLTLKFLGEIKDNELVETCKITEKVAQKHSRFDLEFKKIGYFGGASARVLWVGTEQGSENLIKLANQLDEQLGEIGFTKETRAFTGHLTLCRIKDFKAGVELAKIVDGLGPFKAGESEVEAVAVYQSELSKTGPTYTALGRYKLS